MITTVHKYVWRWKVHLTVHVILAMNYKMMELHVKVNTFTLTAFTAKCFYIIGVHITPLWNFVLYVVLYMGGVPG